MAISHDPTDVGALRALLRRAPAAPAGRFSRETADLLTTGHGALLRIEAELARLGRTVEARLTAGELDELPALLARRRALLAARAGLRADLRALGARRTRG